MRLDIYLKETLGYSRAYAAELISEGFIKVDGKTERRPGRKLNGTEEVVSTGEPMKYVSRGGYKLEKALLQFGIDAGAKVCADFGASTGGFCDCLLQRGAAKVYAVENGRGQLSPSLTTDARLVSLENTDARTLVLLEKCQVITADLSFISTLMFRDSILANSSCTADIVILIKPQFETGKPVKGGIVRDERTRMKAREKVVAGFTEAGLIYRNICQSPIKGGDGNIEYLAHFKRE